MDKQKILGFDVYVDTHRIVSGTWYMRLRLPLWAAEFHSRPFGSGDNTYAVWWDLEAVVEKFIRSHMTEVFVSRLAVMGLPFALEKAAEYGYLYPGEEPIWDWMSYCHSFMKAYPTFKYDPYVMIPANICGENRLSRKLEWACWCTVNDRTFHHWYERDVFKDVPTCYYPERNLLYFLGVPAIQVGLL